MTTTLDIKIQGRDYRVACAPEEMNTLQAAADLLNARMSEIAQATRSSGERLAVMTALNLADELHRAMQATAAVTSVADTQPGAHDSDAAALDADALRGRIKSMEAQLDQLLEPLPVTQETLF